MNDLSSSALSHAGAVVFREDPNGVLVLLVNASDDPAEWVLPKGHIEEGETPAMTAAREVREEAGVKCEIVAKLGVVQYRARGEDVRVAYFLARAADGEGAGSEHRGKAWVPVVQAAGLATHEETWQILALAIDAIRGLAPNRGDDR